MNDMSPVIVPKSDQINADDLIGGPVTITIREVQIKGGQEQPVSMYFHGSDKAYRPCKSMSRVMVAAWGADANLYKGRSLTLYRDPTVKWGGMDVGGIRISHMTDIESTMTMALTATKGSRKPFVVKPLVAPKPTAKPDKIGDGVKALLARIADGEDIDDDPAASKQRKWLEANRPELFAEIEAALQARGEAVDDDDPFGLPAIQEGRSDEQHGEANTTDDAETDILAHLAKKMNPMDVNSLISARKGELDDDGQERLRMAGIARIAEIKDGQ